MQLTHNLYQLKLFDHGQNLHTQLEPNANWNEVVESGISFLYCGFVKNHGQIALDAVKKLRARSQIPVLGLTERARCGRVAGSGAGFSNKILE